MTPPPSPAVLQPWVIAPGAINIDQLRDVWRSHAQVAQIALPGAAYAAIDASAAASAWAIRSTRAW